MPSRPISVDMRHTTINCYNNVIYLLPPEGLAMCSRLPAWDFVALVELDDVNLFTKIPPI